MNAPLSANRPFAVLVCADAEWRVVQELFPEAKAGNSPFGSWFTSVCGDSLPGECVFFHAGWGKTSAAAATQYVIDHWQPQLIINAGTCGGFGEVVAGDLIIPKKTVIYDIFERMADPVAAIESHSVTIDTSWLAGTELEQYVHPVIVSADRDVAAEDIEHLATRYGAEAADWESGSIARICFMNSIPVLVIRGVSDIVRKETCEAYGNYPLFEARCSTVMKKIVNIIPIVIQAWQKAAAR